MSGRFKAGKATGKTLAHQKASSPQGRPQPIAEILSELMTRRGYAREQAAAACAAAWSEAAGELLARHTRCGQVRRGKLEVIVANSTLMQEITFQKPRLLQELARLAPDESIVDLKLRVGQIQ
jgi:predicted nucleic acid-binding Zn ribbon protein